MNANKPVAWFEQDPDMKSIWYQSDQDNPNAIPLYTHPVKEQDESFDRTASHMAGEYVSHSVKEQDTDCQYCKQGCIRCDARKQLTDEEILFIADKVDIPDEPDTKDLIEFARAILRKAQEK